MLLESLVPLRALLGRQDFEDVGQPRGDHPAKALRTRHVLLAERFHRGAVDRLGGEHARELAVHRVARAVRRRELVDRVGQDRLDALGLFVGAVEAPHHVLDAVRDVLLDLVDVGGLAVAAAAGGQPGDGEERGGHAEERERPGEEAAADAVVLGRRLRVRDGHSDSSDRPRRARRREVGLGTNRKLCPASLPSMSAL